MMAALPIEPSGAPAEGRPGGRRPQEHHPQGICCHPERYLTGCRADPAPGATASEERLHTGALFPCPWLPNAWAKLCLAPVVSRADEPS